MYKINFNNQYGLTDAVIDRIKNKTRRIEKGLELLTESNHVFEDGQVKLYFDGSYHPSIIKPRYHVGEIVAVAQPYKDIAENKYFINQCAANEQCVAGMKYEAGWNNKMFVAAYYMPHQIEIMDVCLKRLQDITVDESIAEGIEYFLKAIANKGAIKYENIADDEWLDSRWRRYDYYDQGISYCRNCAERIAKKENKEKGYDENNPYSYHREGGWSTQEEEGPSFCEECGRPLIYSYLPTFYDDDIKWIEFNDCCSLYLLDQMLNWSGKEIKEKTVRDLAVKAYSVLIDKLSGKGTWERNPYVFDYTFKLIK